MEEDTKNTPDAVEEEQSDISQRRVYQSDIIPRTIKSRHIQTGITLDSPIINTPTITSPIITLGSDATGDIYYRNSAGEIARLGIGSTGQILNVAAGLPAWATSSVTVDGWTPETATLTYASASSVTTSGSVTGYPKGTRVKFTNNSTTYYGTVLGTSGSTISFVPNNDFSIVNSAITAPYYSYQLSPVGYKTLYAYTPTTTTGTGSITTQTTIGSFKVEGNVATVFTQVLITTNGTGATDIRVTLPITAVSTSYSGWGSTSAVKALAIGFNTTSQLNIRLYDSTYPGANSTYIFADIIYNF